MLQLLFSRFYYLPKDCIRTSLYLSLSITENYIYQSENYTPLVQLREVQSNTTGASIRLPEEYRNYFDVAWSLSVFTHMWRDSIINTLMEQSKVVNYSGICVNTWLIVDEFARYIMKCGVADRQLPFEVNGALTYSLDNPLVCTAYKIQDVYEIYQKAGHEILDIEFGSWAGRKNEVSYQDVVISRSFKQI